MALNFGGGGNNNSDKSYPSSHVGGEPEHRFHAKYLGGHKAYPLKNAVDTEILVYNDRIEVAYPIQLNIVYSKIKNIENMDEKKNFSLEGYRTRSYCIAISYSGCNVEKEESLYRNRI